MGKGNKITGEKIKQIKRRQKRKLLKNYKNYSWCDENRREIRQNGVIEEMEETLTRERLEEAVLKEERYKRH